MHSQFGQLMTDAPCAFATSIALNALAITSDIWLSDSQAQIVST